MAIWNFVFCGEAVLVKKECADDFRFEHDSFPSDNDFLEFSKGSPVLECFTESQLNYNALDLSPDFSVPDEFYAYPVRKMIATLSGTDFNFSPKAGLITRARSLLKQREIFKFCPTCTSPLIDDSHFSARKCPKCERLFFPRIEPAVIVLVTKGDSILLVKTKNSRKNFYSCVAGFVEQGETLEQAVEREVMEETGIQIKNIKYIANQPWPFPDQLMLAFRAEYKSGEIKLQEEEIADGGWYTKDNMPVTPNPGSVSYSLIKHWKNGDLPTC
ncbi:MAG: NAD(+) diphosphatase [Treponema sp.]|nr:NAD(+) diphosphatase [Treponema sp.]